MKCVIIPVITGATGITKKRFEGKCGSHNRKTFNRVTAKDSCAWDTTRNGEIITVCYTKHVQKLQGFSC
jgi:hypothetical protein